MKKVNLAVAQVYWVAGKGPMQVSELPDPPRKTTITMTTPQGYHHWVSEEELSPITWDLSDYIAQLEARGLARREEVDCIREWNQSGNVVRS